MSPVGCKPAKGLWSVVQPSRRIEVPSQNMLHGGRGSERETRKPWVQTGLLPEVPHYSFTCYMLLAKKKKSHIQGCLHGAGKDMILLRERQVTQFTTAPPHPCPNTHTPQPCGTWVLCSFGAPNTLVFSYLSSSWSSVYLPGARLNVSLPLVQPSKWLYGLRVVINPILQRKTLR